jgi:hypothetical protein
MLESKPARRFIESALGNGGINGGNPQGDLWFCGIEFGLHRDHRPSVALDDQAEDRVQRGCSLPAWTDTYLEVVRGAHGSAWTPVDSLPFMQKMARIVLGWHGEESPDLGDVKKYVRTKLSRPGGETFQLNLYPVAVNSAADNAFDGDCEQVIGLPNKRAYRLWCRDNRFPRLGELVRRYQPRVLVAVGSTFEEDYRLAFLEPPQRYASPAPQLQFNVAGREVPIFKIAGTRTLLAITPFLGQGGLMANADLATVGKRLRELADAGAGA